MGKGIVIYVAWAAALLALISGVVSVHRWFNRAATGISVVEAEPGVRCAIATSADGVAIDCWQIDSPRR